MPHPAVPAPTLEAQPEAAGPRLAWSRWTHCQSSFSLALAPHQPGLYALAEEVVPAGEAGSRRLLAVFEIAPADDLAGALGRLFAASSPWRDALAAGRCYLRYAVIADPGERAAACAALQTWLAQAADAPPAPARASAPAAPAAVAAAELPAPRAAVPAARSTTPVGPPAALPAGF